MGNLWKSFQRSSFGCGWDSVISCPTWGEGQWDERGVIRHTKSSWLAGMGQDHSGSNNNMSHCIPNLSRQRRLCRSVYFSQFVLLYAFDKLSGLVPPTTTFPPKNLSLPAPHVVQFLVLQQPAVLIRALHVFHNNFNTFHIIFQLCCAQAEQHHKSCPVTLLLTFSCCCCNPLG